MGDHIVGEQNDKSHLQVRRTFAVASLGRGRWYWVVWPALAQVRIDKAGAQVADGIALSKLEAIDQALAMAGDDAQWLAASYARRHYEGRAGALTGSVAKQEFVYCVRVSTPNGQKAWHSLPYLIIKRTPKYVFVAVSPDRSGEQVGYWADISAGRIRLARADLEQVGFAFVSFADAELYGLEEPLFYTTPYSEQVGKASGGEDCFAQLELTPPHTVEAVKRAYRHLAKQHHPDRGGAAARFLTLQGAIERRWPLWVGEWWLG